MSEFRPTLVTDKKPHLYLVSDNRARPSTTDTSPPHPVGEARRLQDSGCTVIFAAFPDWCVRTQDDTEEKTDERARQPNAGTACLSFIATSVSGLLRNVVTAYRIKQERLRSRHWLSQMSEKQLRDLGFESRYHAESGGDWSPRASSQMGDLLR
jgi:uncharacterized protein YjiS (DUF1127 family)